MPPADGVAHRALTIRSVARPIAEEWESLREPRQQGIGREQPDTGGCQLQCQWQSLQLPADGSDGAGIFGRQRKPWRDVLSTLDKESHRSHASNASQRWVSG